MIAADFIRPSSMEAAEICPARPLMESRACALVPGLVDLSSVPAQEGTKGHEVLAGLFGDAFAGDWSYAPHVFARMEDRLGCLAAWCKDAVRGCVAYALQVIRGLSERFSSIEVLTEIKLDGTQCGIVRGGTADLVILCRQVAGGPVVEVHVIDHKCGFLSQGEAADHLQLAIYAVMSWDKWHPPSGVTVHLSAGRRREYSAGLYDAELITVVRERVRSAVVRSLHPRPQINPARRACYYCRALPFCRPARNYLMKANEELFLFGADPADRVALADAAAIAKRFAQAADDVAKLWRKEEEEAAQVKS